MGFEVKRRFLLGFLVMFLACTLFVTGEKMEQLVHARDVEELPEDQPLSPPPGLRKRKDSEPPPPPPGASGPIVPVPE
ncbi:hypothetical protein FH972_019130 [Carpinus fangiana]|uniref:Uncharacterized protein n=1 Tax=Carpinus fangiana TaxID=176857 RepID=A0A5N6RPH9_9ROSI|nr:hypothetical protein FH972_019130 [Carpinus fangiana]